MSGSRRARHAGTPRIGLIAGVLTGGRRRPLLTRRRLALRQGDAARHDDDGRRQERWIFPHTVSLCVRLERATPLARERSRAWAVIAVTAYLIRTGKGRPVAVGGPLAVALAMGGLVTPRPALPQTCIPLWFRAEMDLRRKMRTPP